jgi:hypothetical protein
VRAELTPRRLPDIKAADEMTSPLHQEEYTMLGNLWRVAIAGLFAIGVIGCGSGGNGGGSGGGTCAYLEGTWEGKELDPYGAERGTITFVVQGDQVVVNAARYDANPESYTLTATCDDSVTPNRITGKVTASSLAMAVGQPFYAIYELDTSTRSGRLSGLKPGTTTYPTEFTAGNGQRLFLFGQSAAGTGGAGGTP